MEAQSVEAIGLDRLKKSLEIFSAYCLKVADKQGKTVPFTWNAAQRMLHERLEKQIRETGRVRALVLKGRQMGISTYAAARFYHQTTMNFGKRTLIVAHQQKSTNNLFDMVKRYHRHNPMPVSTANSNAIEIVFDKLDSKYALATAGTEDVARGMTAQLAHLSEFAFWTNGQKHMAGLGNTVPDVDGSEILIESTANGLGNAFHQMWSDAEAGKSEYIAVFLPWFLDAAYRAPVRRDFLLSHDDIEYQKAYSLDMEQMQWRANKIATYGDGFEWLWRQEYPATSAEAFQTSTTNPLISPNHVMAAVNSKYLEMNAPLVIGCDPAGDGVNDADRTAIAFRRGRVCFRLEYHQGLNTMQIAGKLAEYWRDFEPDGLFVDKGGLGAGIYDRLIELNIPALGINSATVANDPERYENKRAEMWWTMKEWFEDSPCRIPNDAALISDVTAPQPKVSSNGRKLLEKKEDMKKRQVRSPDGGDALALTFSVPIQYREKGLGGHAGAGKQAATSAGY
jgi:hypothetical protein